MPYANFIPTHPFLHVVLSLVRFAILPLAGIRAGLWSYFLVASRFGSHQLFLSLAAYLECHVGADSATIAPYFVGGWSGRTMGDGAEPAQHLRLLLCQAEHSISGRIFVCGSSFI